MREAIEGLELRAVGSHWSDADVFFVAGTRYGDAFLKRAPVDALYPLRDEAARLDWVDRRVAGPAWWRFETCEDTEMLLTAAVPGRPLLGLLDDLPPRSVVEIEAHVVRTVHERLPVAGCPLHLSNRWQIELSERLRSMGALDAGYLFDVSGGWSVEEALRFLRAHPRADHLDDVVVHGDPYPANVIVDRRSNAWGLVDWGWCGVGDRWHDLTNVYVHLERKLGRRWADVFLAAYGIERDDEALLFFRLLDGLR